MSEKIVQVEIKYNEDNRKLESFINKFLIEKKITRQNLIDIKFCRSEAVKTALIVYEISYKGE